MKPYQLLFEGQPGKQHLAVAVYTSCEFFTEIENLTLL